MTQRPPTQPPRNASVSHDDVVDDDDRRDAIPEPDDAASSSERIRAAQFASLLEDDAVELSAIGNAWLASLYVKPAERGRGFGAQLVNAMMQHAKNIFLKEIFLFTPEHKAFYQTLGWQLLQRATVSRQQVDVMSYQIPGIAQ